MTDLAARTELAQLRSLVRDQEARLAAQEAASSVLRADLARLRRRRRPARRTLSLALVALLIALLPLSLLAAGPFTDLNAGPDHDAANADIQAIADAGITRGCNPPDYTAYCPNDYVTREQMASFLARVAGLGGNAPVASAKTAQTATNATHATSADNAATATNAEQLGGQPARAYLRSVGDLTLRYAASNATLPFGGGTLTPDRYAGVVFTPSSVTSQTIDIALPRPTAMFGTFFAITGMTICLTTSSSTDVVVDQVRLGVSARGAADETQPIVDTLDKFSPDGNTPICPQYVSVAPPTANAGQAYVQLTIKTMALPATVAIHSVSLTLTPVATVQP